MGFHSFIFVVLLLAHKIWIKSVGFSSIFYTYWLDRGHQKWPTQTTTLLEIHQTYHTFKHCLICPVIGPLTNESLGFAHPNWVRTHLFQVFDLDLYFAKTKGPRGPEMIGFLLNSTIFVWDLGGIPWFWSRHQILFWYIFLHYFIV